jgi:hypothetical protein
LSRLPRTAANHALAEGKGALESARVGAGSARMMANAAPVGSGGAAGGAAGGGAIGGGDKGPPETPTPENGGLVPGLDGYMQGLPVSDDLKSGAAWDNPSPRGPSPLRVPPSTAGHDEAEDDLPDGFRLMCQPGPSGRKYAVGQDELGTTIRFIPEADEQGSK